MNNGWIDLTVAAFRRNGDLRSFLKDVGLQQYEEAEKVFSPSKLTYSDADHKEELKQREEAAKQKAEAEAVEAANRAKAEYDAAEARRLARNRGRREAAQRCHTESAVAARDADKKRLTEIQSVQTEQAKRAFALRLFHLHGKPVRCLLCGLEMPK